MADDLTPSTPGTFGRTDNGGFDVWSWLKEHLLHGGSKPGGDPSDPSNMAAEKAKIVAEYAKRGASPNQEAAPAGMSADVLRKAASRTPTQYQQGNAGGPIAAPDDKQPSMIRALWEKGNTPLVPQIQEGWDQLAGLVDPAPTLADANHPHMSQLKGLLAGSMQGLGGLASTLTTPIGLASTLVGGEGFAALKSAAARQGVKTASSINAKQAAALAEYLSKSKPHLPSEFSTEGTAAPTTAKLPTMTPEQAAYKRILAQGGQEPASMKPLKPTADVEILAPGKAPLAQTSLAARIAAGEKVIDPTEIQNGNTWVHNLYGNGFGGYADKKTLATIEDTAQRRARLSAIDVGPNSALQGK